MSMVAAHATAILTRNPEDTSALGSAVPTHLVFTLDLLHDPALPADLAEPLFGWVMAYFRAHPDEHTADNIGRLTGYAVGHSDWLDPAALSTLTMLTIIS